MGLELRVQSLGFRIRAGCLGVGLTVQAPLSFRDCGSGFRVLGFGSRV